MSVLKIKSRKLKKTLLTLVFFVFIFIFLLSSWLSLVIRPLHLKHALNYTIVPRETLAVFIDDLAMRGIIKYPDSIILLSELFQSSVRLPAGNYLIEPNLTLKQLLILLNSENEHAYPVMILPGWTFATLLQHLAANPYLLHDVNDRNGFALMRKLSGQAHSPEGAFLPQIYFVTLGSSEVAVLDRAYQAMQKILLSDWDARQTGLPLQDKTQALILASLIEEESKKTAEMPLIASVFYNRLQAGMRLQSDPTVLYAVDKPYGSHISFHDLKSHSLFNTYTHAGLPPSAIGLPGPAAIWAVLHPTPSPYYYFEANGQGGLIFSKDLQEQDRAILRYK